MLVTLFKCSSDCKHPVESLKNPEPVNGRAKYVFEPPQDQICVIGLCMWRQLARNLGILSDNGGDIQVIAI